MTQANSRNGFAIDNRTINIVLVTITAILIFKQESYRNCNVCVNYYETWDTPQK